MRSSLRYRLNTNTAISTVMATSRTSAGRDLHLITAFRSGSSSKAAGTMLKFAAIGVMRVPQKPLSMPSADIMTGSPPNRPDDQRQTDPRRHHREGCKGVAHDHREEGHADCIRHDCDQSRPTSGLHASQAGRSPARLQQRQKSAPNEASVCGSTAAQPTASMSRRPSRKRREQWRSQKRISERERDQNCGTQVQSKSHRRDRSVQPHQCSKCFAKSVLEARQRGSQAPARTGDCRFAPPPRALPAIGADSSAGASPLAASTTNTIRSIPLAKSGRM